MQGLKMTEKQYNVFLEESILNIKDSLDNNNLSIFAGSAVSLDSNLPSWQDLIDKLKKALNSKEKDFLKVAELFYIQFKENIYYKTINEFFPLNSKPNLLHTKIVSMNIKNIITTNWDDLFEKAIEQEGKFFDIIKKEDDIGYTLSFKKFIKIHGSLDMKNIVFKESDYLDYSLNFPLIENYAKAIFSTDSVLLVGYSLSDPNIKQIISWINHKSDSIKPVYFLKVDTAFDYLEFEYYKKKNIFILYWNDEKIFNSKCQHIEKLKSKKSKMIYSFLEKISVKNIDIENLTLKEFINESYEAFKKILDYDYIDRNTIVNILKSRFNLYAINEIFYGEQENRTILIQNKTICKYLKILQRFNIKSINDFIINILQKANLTTIKCFDNYNSVVYSTELLPKELNNYLYDFDFKALDEEIENISDNYTLDGNEDKLLKKAFLLYQKENFKESYLLLKDVSKVSFKNRKFDIWFISEFNKTYLCNLMRNDERYLKDKIYQEKIECYCKEINKINLSLMISKLPQKYQIILEPLLNLKFKLKEKLLSTILLVDNVNTDLENKRKGGFGFNQNFENLIKEWEEIEFFISYYYLTIEHDGQIQYIYENIFKAILLFRLKNKDYQIGSYIISLGIRNFGNYKELLKFLNEKLTKEELFFINNEENKNLIILQNNLIKKLKIENKIFANRYYKYYYNLLVLMSSFKLTKEQFGFVLDGFNDLLKSKNMMLNDYEVVNIFIVKQYEKNKNNIDTKSLENSIKEYIYKFINSNFNFYDIESISHTRLFQNIFNILKNIDSNYIFDDINILKRFIDNIHNLHIQIQYKISIMFLIGLWFVGTEEVKQTIKNYYIQLLNLKNENLKICDKLELIYIIIANNIETSLKDDLLKEITIVKENIDTYEMIEKIKIMDCIENIEKGLKNEHY